MSPSRLSERHLAPHRIEEAQESNLLIGLDQLMGDFESNRSTKGEPGEVVGTAGLDGAYLRQVARRNGVDGSER